MAQPATPRGHEVHKKRIASDTAEWHKRLDELAEIRREAAKSGLFEMTAGKGFEGITPVPPGLRRSGGYREAPATMDPWHVCAVVAARRRVAGARQWRPPKKLVPPFA